MISTRQYSIGMEQWSAVFETHVPSPVLLSVPHDGLQTKAFSGFFEQRKTGYRGRDRHVWPVVKDVLLSVQVNAIRGLAPRTFVDYNRAWPTGINYYPLTQKDVHTALDDERLLPAHEYYHATVDRILGASIAAFGKKRVLLMDMHGFSKQPPYAPPGGFDLILGTGNRASIPHGDVDERFAWHMAGRGYQVFLSKDLSLGPEEDYYSADYTTRHHSEKHGINVIQVEIASKFRTREGRELGQKLSADIADFIRQCSL